MILQLSYITDIQTLQFYLKLFQEIGLHAIDDSFAYSSINKSNYLNSIMDPIVVHEASSGIDVRPKLPSSIPTSFKTHLVDSSATSNKSTLSSCHFEKSSSFYPKPDEFTPTLAMFEDLHQESTSSSCEDVVTVDPMFHKMTGSSSNSNWDPNLQPTHKSNPRLSSS